MTCDALASTILVPELQAWVNEFIKGSSVNRYEIPLPVDIGDVYLSPQSFIALLLTTIITQFYIHVINISIKTKAFHVGQQWSKVD